MCVQMSSFCVCAVMFSAINASSSLSETELVAQSLDIQHDLITLFAFIDQTVFKCSVSFIATSQLNILWLFLYFVVIIVFIICLLCVN